MSASLPNDAYPNPTSGVLETGLREPTQLQILDTSGRIVIERRATRLDLSELQSGIYILQALIDGAFFSQQVVKY